MPALLAHAAILSAGEPAAAQGTDETPFATTIIANVARIRAGDRTGFGFIVGLGERQLVLATAFHTLEGPGGDEPTICFPHHGETCATGSIYYVADAIGVLPRLDLAFLTVPYPEGLAWRPDAMAKLVEIGTDIRSVGRGRDWYVPAQPGRVSDSDRATRLVHYTGLSVAEGVSGAPIVSENGIIAMHVQSLGGEDGAQGIELAAIRERLVTQARGQWILVPRADCQQLALHRSALSGRAITVHFDAGSPDAAMQATARLHCLGASVTLSPVWDASEWPGERITYSSGDVRLMRSLQSALAAFGRLQASLGEPVGDAELWIR